MSNSSPSPLATSEDLRSAAIVFYDPLRRRLETLADALDQLHATPELRDAMAQLENDLARPGTFYTLPGSVSTVLSALRLLYPPGETK